MEPELRTCPSTRRLPASAVRYFGMKNDMMPRWLLASNRNLWSYPCRVNPQAIDSPDNLIIVANPWQYARYVSDRTRIDLAD